jgi:hypothetical protein
MFLSKLVSDGVWWDHAAMALDRDVNVVTGVCEVENGNQVGGLNFRMSALRVSAGL